MEKDLPNGPVAAVLIAGGFGSMILGLMTVLVSASAAIKSALTWSAAVGPLSGKTGIGSIAFFGSWIVLHFIWRGKNVNFNRAATVAFVLLALSLVFTFPPFYDLFVPAK